MCPRQCVQAPACPEEDTTRPMPDAAAQAVRRRADHRGVRIALVVSLLLLAAVAPAAQAATGETRIIVGHDSGLTGSERAQIRREADVEHVANLQFADTEVVQTDDPKAALT